MRYIILHILCEGQTEERFVKEVLSPYLQQFNIFPKPILLLTSRKKNAHGGMLSYLQAKRDLNIIRRQCRDNDSEHHVITTMFDYYALPADFPGFQKSCNINDVRTRVALIEEEMSNDMGWEVSSPTCSCMSSSHCFSLTLHNLKPNTLSRSYRFVGLRRRRTVLETQS